MSLNSLIPILQTSIGPVILISGVALLLLTMTNRYGRIIDWSRKLSHALRFKEDGVAQEKRENVIKQLRLLSKRARIVRTAIGLASLSVLFVALLIINIFLDAILGLNSIWSIGGLFIGSMLFLISSLIYFLIDINLSLEALWVDEGVIGNNCLDC